MTVEPTDPLRYAGFWPRLGAILLDMVFMLLPAAIAVWGWRHYRLFGLYYLILGILFGLFYGVYLVKRFGGTPGKLIVGIRIRKVSGEPVGYREAFLRYLPDCIFGILMSVALLISALHMSDAEYDAIPAKLRLQQILERAPSWHKPEQVVENIWVWSELVVLLTNRKRRALHDFIAGTVVIKVAAKEPPMISATIPAG